MQGALQDLKHALRMFSENPLFTATALAALDPAEWLAAQ